MIVADHTASAKVLQIVVVFGGVHIVSDVSILDHEQI